MNLSKVGSPSRVIFATDFSARSDRAQDRAVQLALQWNASLTAVHALNEFDVPSDVPSRQGSPKAVDRLVEQLRDEFSMSGGLHASIVVESGKPAEVVLDVLGRERGELIVTGIASNNPVGKSLLGSTVTSLVRRSPVPVLVVKKKVWELHERVVVATDLSDLSPSLIELAVEAFSPERIVLFHAFHMPFSTFVDSKADYEAQARSAAIDECRHLLARIIGETDAARVEVVAQYGDPAKVLSDFIAERDVDLVLVGTRGWSGIANAVLGSVANHILDEAPCDVLIVPSRAQ